MFECQAIASALNHNYKGSYEDFELDVTSYIKDYMNYLFIRYDIDREPNVEVKDLSVCGLAKGLDYVCYNKKIIKDLMNGDKLSLLVIYHELSHIEHNIQFFKDIAWPNIIRQTKETMLDIYERKNHLKILEEDNSYFKKLNYDDLSIEVDADLNAIVLLLIFFKTNDIDYTDTISDLEKLYMQLTAKEKNLRRYVASNPVYNSYYLSIDEAFDSAISSNPNWLKEIPILNVEYIEVDNVVVKKDKIVYPQYEEKYMDFYHLFNGMIGELSHKSSNKVKIKK